MTKTYTWSYDPLVSPAPVAGLSGVVTAYGVTVLVADGENAAIWYDRVRLDAPDPSSFTAFPQAGDSEADKAAFRALLKGWALDHFGVTAAQIEARADAQLALEAGASAATPLP